VSPVDGLFGLIAMHEMMSSGKAVTVSQDGWSVTRCSDGQGFAVESFPAPKEILWEKRGEPHRKNIERRSF
jgi:hypothetical protein